MQKCVQTFACFLIDRWLVGSWRGKWMINASPRAYCGQGPRARWGWAGSGKRRRWAHEKGCSPSWPVTHRAPESSLSRALCPVRLVHRWAGGEGRTRRRRGGGCWAAPQTGCQASRSYPNERQERWAQFKAWRTAAKCARLCQRGKVDSAQASQVVGV